MGPLGRVKSSYCFDNFAVSQKTKLLKKYFQDIHRGREKNSLRLPQITAFWIECKETYFSSKVGLIQSTLLKSWKGSCLSC